MARPRLNLDPQMVIDTVVRLDNITHAADELGCSTAYVAKILADAGTSLTGLREEASRNEIEREGV